MEDVDHHNDVRYFRCFEWRHDVKKLLPDDVYVTVHQIAINLRLRDEAVFGGLLATIAGVIAGRCLLRTDGEEDVNSALALMLVGPLESRVTDAVKDITTLPMISCEKKLSEPVLINSVSMKGQEIAIHVQRINCSGLLCSGLMQSVFTDMVKPNTVAFSLNHLTCALNGRQFKLDVHQLESASRGNRNNSSVFQLGDLPQDKQKPDRSVTFLEPCLTVFGGFTHPAFIDTMRVLVNNRDSKDFLEQLLVVSVSSKVPTAREQRQGNKTLSWELDTFYHAIRQYFCKSGSVLLVLPKDVQNEVLERMAVFCGQKTKGQQRPVYDGNLRRLILKVTLVLHVMIHALRNMSASSCLSEIPEVEPSTAHAASDFVAKSWRQLLIYVYGETDILYDKMRAVLMHPGKVVLAKEFLNHIDGKKLFASSMEQVVQVMQELDSRGYGSYVLVKRATEAVNCFVKAATGLDAMQLKILIIEMDEYQYALACEPDLTYGVKTEWRKMVEFVLNPPETPEKQIKGEHGTFDNDSLGDDTSTCSSPRPHTKHVATTETPKWTVGQVGQPGPPLDEFSRGDAPPSLSTNHDDWKQFCSADKPIFSTLDPSTSIAMHRQCSPGSDSGEFDYRRLESMMTQVLHDLQTVKYDLAQLRLDMLDANRLTNRKHDNP